eukprot:CAMPEP_0205901272 /NCGR_PEP_ID=MMETSP1083-20121108/27588_1 /ASSEMBLY_ACC=CAM_ASM_000430 /TAXON_ID=97485 /ORGANISM="Prymnesium parvum, Strain Texoma1" /LENGTH=214 /DNA_ID=CAMNT_0053266779 /DNA_START=102 /DNA_END=743 /DNA_ORIENTATION=-
MHQVERSIQPATCLQDQVKCPVLIPSHGACGDKLRDGRLANRNAIGFGVFIQSLRGGQEPAASQRELADRHIFDVQVVGFRQIQEFVGLLQIVGARTPTEEGQQQGRPRRHRALLQQLVQEAEAVVEVACLLGGAQQPYGRRDTRRAPPRRLLEVSVHLDRAVEPRRLPVRLDQCAHHVDAEEAAQLGVLVQQRLRTLGQPDQRARPRRVHQQR